MAKIFIDANIFIDLVENRTKLTINDLNSNDLFISSLSAHILMYTSKKKVPYPILSEIIKRFSVINFNYDILGKALTRPTSDFEDNVQLHSAADADCDIFLTNDAGLLKLKFFGKTEIKNSLSL